MRIRITLNMEEKLSINYKYELQGLIYKILSSDLELSSFLHDEGYEIDNKKFKLFTISNIIGKSKFNSKDRTLSFVDNAYFEISSFYEEPINHIVKAITLQSTIRIGKNNFDIIKFEIIKSNYKLHNEMTFNTISPITIYKTEDKKTIYFNPFDETFKEILILNIIKKYYLIFNEYPQEFQISKIDSCTKMIMKFKGTIIEAYNCDITFKNLDKKLFDVIFKTGIGSKNSGGFGMLKLKEF